MICRKYPCEWSSQFVKRRVKCFLLSIDCRSRVSSLHLQLLCNYCLISRSWFPNAGLVVPLLLIGVANPRNVGWTASCWVLIAGHIVSLFLSYWLDAVLFFLSLWLELPIRETPAPSTPLLARPPDQFQIQNPHLYLLVDRCSYLWLLLIGVANPQNAGWNASCWVLIAGCASSHLFVSTTILFFLSYWLDAVPFFLSLWSE